MKLSDFDFELPAELIADRPLERRDASRMLVVNNGLTDSLVTDFPKFIQPGDVVVFNNSKVIPARFMADDYEMTLHTQQGENWWALARKFNKLNIGDILKLDDGTEIEIIDKDDESGVLIKFHCDNIFAVLDKVGKMPLPPYMKRDEELSDRERYQTVYADDEKMGSMAAPTAGLHFTPELLDAIRDAGAEIVYITLHVGSGTWMPVKVDNVRDHKMHAEWGEITSEQADIINGAKRIIAIGTTPMRLLESAAQNAGENRIAPFCGETDIFITPGYEFRAVDVLFTNYHLPKSTLFMLVSAFAGLPEMQGAYTHAIAEKYRFFSYGDCCLLFKK